MKKVITTSLLFLFCIAVKAQTDTTKQVELNDIYRVEIDLTGNYPLKVERRDHTSLKSIVVNVGYGWPLISNDFDFLDENSGNALQFGVYFRKQFTKERAMNDRVYDVPTAVAIGVGLGLSHFKKSIGFKSLIDSLTIQDDKVKDRYTLNMNYSDVKEQLSLTYLDIPVYLEFGKPSKTKFQPFVRIGLKGSVLINNSFTGEGTYTSTGHYSQIDGEKVDVVISGVDKFGFYNGKKLDEPKPDLNLNTFVLWSTTAAGFSFPLSSPDKDVLRNIILRMGIKWEYPFMSISKDIDTESQYTNAKYWHEQCNILKGSGSKMQYFGLEVGLIFDF